MAVRRTEPLEHDEYLKRRDALRRDYTESMREYDRLVTWASGGALALSITFLDKFGQNADPATKWWLGAGWIFLGLAFAASLWSQYFSSRVHSWRSNELDHLQKAPDDRDWEPWSTTALHLDRVSTRYGLATKYLTFISGVLLLGGIMSVAVFAFRNAPFKSANTPGQTSVPVPVTDKKGLEYHPEPVPRPQPAPPKTPPPQEKR
jgi:hypothetical protein